MAEGVLGLAGDGRVLLAADELLALERVQPLLHRPPREPGDRRRAHPTQTTLPSTAASWSTSFSSAVSASSRAAMMPWMDSGSSAASSTLGPAPSARTPPRRADSRRRGRGAPTGARPASSDRSIEQADQLRGLALGQRRERDRGRVALSAAPAGATFQQLRTGGANAQAAERRSPTPPGGRRNRASRRRPIAGRRKRGRAALARQAPRRTSATLRTPRPAGRPMRPPPPRDRRAA